MTISQIASVEDKITEWQTIEIPTKDDERLRITNLYVPPVRTNASRGTITQAGDPFDASKWPAHSDDLILGDINAHSSLWDDNWDGQPDARGKIIEEWMANTNMAFLNDGSPTHTNRTTGKRTAPDMAFAHPSMLDKMSWEVRNDFSSDHLPIIISYDDTMPMINDKPTYKWNLKKARWDDFTSEVDRLIPKIYPATSLNKLEKKLRKAIIKSAKKHVGKKKITVKSKSFITPEIKAAIHQRNQLRDTIGQNRDEWIKACTDTAEMIREEKKARWVEYVETLDRTTDSRKVWRTIRGLDGRRAPENRNEVLEVDGVAYVEDKDKAEQFAKTYRSFAKLPVRKKDRKIRKKNRRMSKIKSAAQECERDLTMQEMTRAIGQTKANKAAGEDEIPYEFIRHLGPKAKELLLNIFQRCWDGDGIPTKWRTAIIKPLLKEGKDSKDTVSYRPVSLTSCMGKILEKMVADRLMLVLETGRLLNDNQAGFRQNRCTTDQILKLVQEASDQIHAEGSNHRLIATFFDYEKAFDKVWRDGLIHKMHELNIPARYIRYVRHLLSGRTTRVEINGTRSNPFTLKEGLPQGSSISPILFLVYINDIDMELDQQTTASLFADDTAIWLKDGKIRGDGEQLAQQEIDKILAWADR